MQATIAAESVIRMPDMSDDEFFDFCADNGDYRIERDSAGRVTIMPGTGGRTGNRNSEINFQMQGFARRGSSGKAFDSSTMFLLPNGAMRSPDAAWVAMPKLLALNESQRERFLPLAPDFLIELMSPSDRLRDAQDKMEEWVAAGCQLAWLLDPGARAAYVYRPAGMTMIENPSVLTGEGPVEGFTLDLGPVWNPGW